MWAAYFLQSTMRVYPLRPSYFPVTEAGAPLTLVARPDSSAHPPASRYVVVKRAPPVAK